MNLNPGDRPLESRIFQIIWGSYLALLSISLMKAANTRAGNFDGFSIALPVIMLGFGIVIAYVTSRSETSAQRLGLFLVSVLGFGVVMWIGYMILPGLQASSKIRPFLIATLGYMIVIAVVFIRLQRPVSPPANDDGEYNTDLFQVHFNNSWRMFQIILSLSAVVGFIISIGILILQRQEVIIQPLSWFIGGILLSILPLTVQFWYEMRFLERAYKS